MPPVPCATCGNPTFGQSFGVACCGRPTCLLNTHREREADQLFAGTIYAQEPVDLTAEVGAAGCAGE